MMYPVWSIADKSRFNEAAPLKALRIIQINKARYFALFTTREKADEHIAVCDTPGTTVPLLIPDYLSFKEALEYAKRNNAKQGVQDPRREGDQLQGDIFDIV